MKIRLLLLILFLCNSMAGLQVSAAVLERVEPSNMTFGENRENSQIGDSRSSVKRWTKMLQELDKESPEYLVTLVKLAGALQNLGRHQQAMSHLEVALPVAEKCEDGFQQAQFYSVLADVYLSYGKVDKALIYLEKGALAGSRVGDPLLAATLLNNIGNVFSGHGLFAKGEEAYKKALSLLKTGLGKTLKARIAVNLLRLSYAKGDYLKVGEDVQKVKQQLDLIPDSRKRTETLLAMATLAQKTAEKLPTAKTKLLKLTYEALQSAIKIAKKSQDSRTLSLAYGVMGELYEQEFRNEEAIGFTRQALFHAKAGSFPELLYRWQWQLGRLFKVSGDKRWAIKSYQKAIATLGPIRSQFFKGYRGVQNSFADEVKPVYLGLTELYLEEAETMAAGPDKDLKLRMARDTMELLKNAELEDFFHDECVLRQQDNPTSLIAPGSAILYPIPLQQRLALLLEVPEGMRLFFVPVHSAKLTNLVGRFRIALENWGEFEESAMEIYQLLIKPIEEELQAQEVETLITAPDGVLRLIPFAALFDGQQFLIEKYALVTIPSLSQTNQEDADRKNMVALINGLSKGRQEEDLEFSSLPAVPSELSGIQTLLGGVKLLDQEYTIANLTSKFKQQNFDILHMATHGMFGGSAASSFLLTHDSRLTLNQLESLIDIGRYRQKKVELLTLSACQTAQGDERAAFGLAGVAVKAGVKSVLAALWSVDDMAASRLVQEFYRQLLTLGASKAHSLQNAQKQLIEQPRFWHPSFWSAFLLMGNWK